MKRVTLTHVLCFYPKTVSTMFDYDYDLFTFDLVSIGLTFSHFASALTLHDISTMDIYHISPLTHLSEKTSCL